MDLDAVPAGVVVLPQHHASNDGYIPPAASNLNAVQVPDLGPGKIYDENTAGTSTIPQLPSDASPAGKQDSDEDVSPRGPRDDSKRQSQRERRQPVRFGL